MLPVLWVIAAAGEEQLLGAGILVAASTDVLDGVLARTLHMRSEFGSRLDSIADHLLTGSVVIWLLVLKPEFTQRFAPWLIAWALLAAVTLLVGWLRFRRLGDLHLISAKVAMVLAYIFVSALFLFDGYRPVYFWIVLGLAFVGVAESLLVYLTRRNPDERIASILFRPKAPNDSPAGKSI